MHILLLIAGVVLTWSGADAARCLPSPRNTLTGKVRTPSEVMCQPCEKLFSSDSSFVQNCGRSLRGEITISSLNKSCLNQDVDQFADFLPYLHNLCGTQRRGDFEDPSTEECECDVCDLLFDENSDFMRRCAFDFSEKNLDKLRERCDIADCSSYGLIRLEKYLKKMCLKLERPFRFPSCECDECLQFFADDSPFMQKCGASLDEQTLDNLYEICALSVGDVDALFNFFMTVRNLCKGCGFEHFPLPVCDCSNYCWHLFDTTRQFYQECFSKLPFTRRVQLFRRCGRVYMHPTLSQLFIANLEKECATHVGVEVEVPTDCTPCSEGQFDLIMLVDNSGSIGGNGPDIKAFLEEIVESFTISDTNTRVGIIRFATSPTVMTNLATDNNQADVLAAIASIPTPGGGTNTRDGIAEMNAMFSTTNIGNKRIGIVITDGYGNLQLPNDSEVGAIPADLEMFAVGIGNYNQAELLAIARGDTSHVFTVNDFDELSGKVEEIRDELCSPEPGQSTTQGPLVTKGTIRPSFTKGPIRT